MRVSTTKKLPRSSVVVPKQEEDPRIHLQQVGSQGLEVARKGDVGKVAR